MARRRLRFALASLLALWLVALASTPVALAVPGPGSECDAEVPPSGQTDPCTDGGGGGGGGFDLGFVLPLAGAVVIGGALALGGAYFLLRRRAGPPLQPVDSEEWWTCQQCGRNNVVGSARCYACGTWKR